MIVCEKCENATVLNLRNIYGGAIYFWPNKNTVCKTCGGHIADVIMEELP